MLAHGLTATRRYVVMGSSALERGGHRVIAYDARGHGASSPAQTPEAYRYEDLGADLEAVLDRAGRRAGGAGRGIDGRPHAAVAGAAAAPSGSPAWWSSRPRSPAGEDDAERLTRWDALSDGLRDGGIDGFLAAYGEPQVPERWRETVVEGDPPAPVAARAPRGGGRRAARRAAVAPVSVVWPSSPRSRVPTVVVASDDEADPEHPRAVGEAYARGDPRRPAGHRRARPLTDRVAGQPAVQADRRGGGAGGTPARRTAGRLARSAGERLDGRHA